MPYSLKVPIRIKPRSREWNFAEIQYSVREFSLVYSEHKSSRRIEAWYEEVLNA
jgi:hypothetical protein